MTSEPRAKERTALPPQAEAMATGREKKRKRFSFSDNATKINRIKFALAEVIADTDPKDAKTSEILGHLTTAHAAIETASSLLSGNGQMHRTLTDPSGPRCHVTMLGRAAIFHQWQASRADLTCPTDEKSVKWRAPVYKQGWGLSGDSKPSQCVSACMNLVSVIGRKQNNRGLHSAYWAFKCSWSECAQGHESATIRFFHPVPGFPCVTTVQVNRERRGSRVSASIL